MVKYFASPLLLAVLVFSLAGCAPDRETLPNESNSATRSPSAQTPDSSASATPDSSLNSTPVDIACRTLISDQVIYDWGNGNWAGVSRAEIVAGSSAEFIAAHEGTVCGWVNATSSEPLTVAVASFDSASMQTVRARIASEGDAFTEFGVEGYFATAEGISTIDVFVDEYWISLSSSWFLEPRDAEPLVLAARDAVTG